MLFNSFAYLFFFAAVAALHLLVPRRFRWLLLLLASWAFYMSWNVAYIGLIWASTAVDYAVGRALGRVEAPLPRRLLLLTSLGANLGLLFTFKYWDFANDGAAALAAAVGLDWRVPDLEVLLPVGISFYTFQTLSYTIDLYRRRIEPERHLGRFALYVAFFPQLVAGPIERAGRLLPQIDRPRTPDWPLIASGLELMLWGLFKKVVIADRLAIYVDVIYADVERQGPASLLLATWLFAFQIYCDFSGYSDIAIGSARVLGFDLMENFRRPYFAQGLQDFWRRWHISLSTWLRDYLYIPLGGSRAGEARTYINLAITMLLGGLWHGASLGFVVWGAWHGALLVLGRATVGLRDRLWRASGAPDWLRAGWRMFATFQLVCVGWVFFRAASPSDALTVFASLAGQGRPWGLPLLDPNTLAHAALGLIVLLAVQVFQERRFRENEPPRSWLAERPLPVRWATAWLLILSIAAFGVEHGVQFIYFQF